MCKLWQRSTVRVLVRSNQDLRLGLNHCASVSDRVTIAHPIIRGAMEENDITMPLLGAQQMIWGGAELVHIRHWMGPYFLAMIGWKPEFTQICKEVPSFTWIPEQKSWKVHYLDLPTLEGIVYNNKYMIKYDPECIPKLRALKAMYLERRAWKEQALVEIPMKRTPRVYQVIGSQFMYKAQRCLNADGMGAGKTGQAIGAILLNKMDGKSYKTLVICPSSVKGEWAKEILRITDELPTIVLDSKMEKRYAAYEGGMDKYAVGIISYDGFIADYDEICNYFKPDILIIDECHRIANRKNKITQALIGGKTIKKTFAMMCDLHSVYLLTGTPINNKLEDLYAMLKLIDPGIFSWTGFGNRYTIVEECQRWLHTGGVKRVHKFQKISGYRNEKELKAKLSLHMIRRTKDQILPELPPKVFEVLEIELDAEERKIYKDLQDDYKASIRGQELTVPDALVWMTRACQIANSLETVPGSATKKSSKLIELLKIVEAEAPQRKILVFSKFKTMTTILERELKHLHPLHLNGDVPSLKRTEMIEQFQTDPKYRVFISTIKAGGVGITLTAADLVIFYDIAWTPAANAQAADRVHRIGQKNSVLVLTLRAKDTVEERLYEVCMGKQEIIDDMIGDEKSVMARLTIGGVEDLI